MNKVFKMAWWGIHSSVLGWVTYFGVYRTIVPAWVVSSMWWVMAGMAMLATMDWTYRLDAAREGRSVPWVCDYLFGLTMIMMLAMNHWYFTGMAVVAMTIFEALIFSTNPAEWEAPDENNNGNT